MKKYILSFFIALSAITAGFNVASASETLSKITIDGTLFEMTESNCTYDSEACQNTYYKPGENVNNWTEQFVVEYWANVDDFHKISEKLHSQGAAYMHKEKDFDILTFSGKTSWKNINYDERHVVKITKAADNKGSVGMRYVKRYVYNPAQAENDKFKSEVYKTIRDCSSMFRVLPSVEVYKKPLNEKNIEQTKKTYNL